MKKTTMVLALMAVVAMTSACFAEMSFNLVAEPDPAPGLKSFIVQVTGTKDFVGLKILNNIHQANPLGFGGSIQPTVFRETLGEFGLDIYDTSFVFPNLPTFYTTSPGFVVNETNQKNNPAGLPVVAGLAYGMGTFGTGTTSDTLSLAAMPDHLNFMRVVARAQDLLSLDTAPVLTGRGIVDGVMVPFSVTIPEPSTIALLIAGVLGLLVARFRK